MPFITGQDLNILNNINFKHISKIHTKNIKINTTNRHDILISCAGTVGKIEYVYKNIYENVFASEKVIKLTVNKQKIHPGFVYLFLISSLGQEQIKKYITGSVIEWIRENHIASIRIPLPKDKGVALGKKANSICEKRQKALDLENQAIEMIEQELSKWLD